VIVVTPDLERVGPCDVVVAVPVARKLVSRLDLLEELAGAARAALEVPEDTDAAGHLAELLRAAGYPLREEVAA
jgi:hypothetical protein